MYAVVGCSDCQMLWIVEGRPETSTCPRCGTTRGYEKRRQFVTTEDREHARDVRASMLASRSGHEEAFAELDSVAELDRQVAEAGIDDETYLDGAGLDADAIAEHVEHESTNLSREETVREALRELDEPRTAAVVQYATERGVSASYVETALSKLVQAGDATENGGVYRLL